TEKRRHRWMIRREAETVGMFAQVRQPQRSRIGDEQTQYSVPLGQRPNGRPLGLAYAHRDELAQGAAGLVEHAERTVAGMDQFRRRLDDALQRSGDIEVGPDNQDRAEKPPQLA